MDGYYVPNNPAYGQPGTQASLLSSAGGSASSNHLQNQQEFLSLDCGSLLDPTGAMANYGYGDLDPLSSFLAFTPCSPTYKDCGYKEKPVHDMADVLLSLKQAVLHPSGASPTGSSPLSSGGFAPPSATSSYASNGVSGTAGAQPPQIIHTSPGYGSTSAASSGLPGCGGHASYSCIYPQIQLSSNGHHFPNQGVYYPSDYGHHSGACSLGGSGGAGSSAGQLTPTGLHHQTAVFPASMSVNLSMNMTMGPPNNGPYSSTDPTFPGSNLGSGSQVHQWSSPSPVGTQYMVNANGGPTSGGLNGGPAPHSLQVTTYGGSGNSPTGTASYNCGANYHGGPPPNTYTFTAEFRPTGTTAADNLVPLPPIDKEFLTTSFRPLTVNYFADTKPEILSPCKMKTRSSSSRFSSPIFESSLYTHGHHSSDSPLHDSYQSENIAVESSLSPPIQCDVSSPSALHGMRDPDDEDDVRAHLNCSPPSPCSDTGGSDDPCSPNGQQDNGGSNGTSRTNLCRICGKTYARPSTLKTHLRTHSGERPYRCGTCNKSFSQAANLTAHIRTHSGEKPFRCPVCERRFSQSSSVTTHMRTHSGERPYRCCMCKKAFSDSSTLTKHLRIHSGEKPYQCKLCLLRFSQSGNLNRHMRVHANSA